MLEMETFTKVRSFKWDSVENIYESLVPNS